MAQLVSIRATLKSRYGYLLGDQRVATHRRPSCPFLAERRHVAHSAASSHAAVSLTELRAAIDMPRVSQGVSSAPASEAEKHPPQQPRARSAAPSSQTPSAPQGSAPQPGWPTGLTTPPGVQRREPGRDSAGPPPSAAGVHDTGPRRSSLHARTPAVPDPRIVRLSKELVSTHPQGAPSMQQLLQEAELSNAEVRQLLSLLGRSDAPEVALDAFRCMSAKRHPAWVQDPVLYTLLMQMFSRRAAGGALVALDIFEEMRGDGVAPDLVAFNCALAAAGKAGRWGRLQEVLAKMEAAGVARDAFTYTALLHACQLGGRWQQALTWFAELEAQAQAQGWQPKEGLQGGGEGAAGEGSEGASPAAAGGEGGGGSVEAMPRGSGGRMSAHGPLLPAQQQSPRRAEQGAAAEHGVPGGAAAVGAAGHAVRAERAGPQGRMGGGSSSSSLLPAVVQGEALLGSSSNQAEMEEGVTEKEGMAGVPAASASRREFPVAGQRQGRQRGSGSRARPLTPNVVHYTALMSVLQRAGRWEQALEVFGRMEGAGVQPDVQAYNSAIAACAKGLDWERAWALFTDMRRAGLAPSAVSYNALISACERCGQVDRALEVFERMKRKGQAANTVTYNTLISACGKGGRYGEAGRLHAEMQAGGVADDVFTLSSLITACEKAGRWREAQAHFMEFQKRGIAPNTVSYNALISTLGSSGQWEAALQAFQTMREDPHPSVSPDVVTYGSLIAALERGGEWRRALGVYEEMREEGLRANGYIITSLLNACEKGGQWDRAGELFKLMQDLDMGMDSMTMVARKALYAFPWLISTLPAPLVQAARAAVESGRAARRWIREKSIPTTL